MVLLDMKNEATSSSSSSPLNLSTPSDEPEVSFSELLKGVSEKKDDKAIQNGSLILSFGDEEKGAKNSKSASKTDTLLSLLKNEESPSLEEPLELNPKLTATLTTKEIKTLVAEAKNYLKDKILSSDDFKKSSIKELPKTLKGLVEVAKKFGIDISKITIEEVKAHSDIKSKDVKTLAVKENNKSPQQEIAQEKRVAIKEVVTAESKEENQDKKMAIKEIVQEKKEAIKEIVQEKKAMTTEPKEVIQDKKAITPQVADKEKNITTKAASTSQSEQTQQVKEIRSDEKFTQIQREVKATPLFKAQATVEHTTTEQIVQVKANSSLKVEQKTPKDKADETLKLLLRGEKPSMKNPALTVDFSVATAKVIAPNATTDISKSIEALLHGEQGTTSKVDALTTSKADSFEVKLNEAKQMIKYLSNDVKTAIEDYKSPFTRVKIQLNPQRLGEVDLTIVQRGKNLHVNISSNNTAVNTLAMNANELRVQLSNSGINNATLNFSNNSQNGENAQQQQQSRQNEQQAHEEYNYFDNEEANEEILSSLEIIVPQYV
ncbi:MAG: flagellar hook-length control protein FliK [Sulfurimonas sp.]|nr:flagellar hook-length control protein FliK [Sulfurimonas sp.]